MLVSSQKIVETSEVFIAKHCFYLALANFGSLSPQGIEMILMLLGKNYL